ncbi:MAG: enolase, partial [Candidatus Micrarchaeota archaeon]|nr:enolase [Candidatus Micrarchaeota archaeon]
KITHVLAREILDSRGNPTVQADVWSEKGFGRAASPSGASTGIHEALELRDGGTRFNGKGVKKAVANVNGKITTILLGKEALGQSSVDSLLCALDGTPNKSRLGANATTAVSLAVAQCAANERKVGLYSLMGGRKIPAPMMNVLNGGKHAGSGLAIQEFMIFPLYFNSFASALQAGCETYHALGALVAKKYGKAATGLGDEGGFAPPCKTAQDALNLIESAIDECGYGKQMRVAIDAASSSFYDAKSHKYKVDSKTLSASQLTDFYASNSDRIKTALRHNSISALLLKVNQIGTLSEAHDAALLCRSKRLGVVVSHRSGETEDATIADIAVGLNCGQIKTGAPARAERTAKYNRLLQIEEELGSGRFARDSGLVL